jgi:hypothetical protein
MEATEVPATTLPDRQVKVFTPPKNAGPVGKVPPSFFEMHLLVDC